MTITGTQNRQYDETKVLMVRVEFIATAATLSSRDSAPPLPLTFNWNDRAAVRNFATINDSWIRRGGRTELEAIQ